MQQYVPVTMVEQGGRLMVGASWAAPSGRQMALVPSWQQLQQPALQQPGTDAACVVYDFVGVYIMQIIKKIRFWG